MRSVVLPGPRPQILPPAALTTTRNNAPQSYCNQAENATLAFDALRGKRMVRLTFPLIPLIFLLLQVSDTIIRKVPSLQPTQGRGAGSLRRFN